MSLRGSWLSILLPLVVSTGAWGQEPTELQVVFTRKAKGTAPEASEPPLHLRMADLIRGARSEVLFCMYRLDHQEVVRALIAARGRGVTVKVVTDQDWAGSKWASAFKELSRGGVEVRVERAVYDTVMHHKFMTIDGEVLWVGDWNAYRGDSAVHHSAIVARHRGLAAVFARRFARYWAGETVESLRELPPRADRTVRTRHGSVVVHWPPAVSGGGIVSQAIAAARTRVLVGHAFLGDRQILNELIAARGRGLEVRGLVGFPTSTNVPVAALHGVDFRVPSLFFAARYVLIDDDVLITGSWNAGGGGRDHDSLLVVRGERALCRAFRAHLDGIFEKTTPFFSASSGIACLEGAAAASARKLSWQGPHRFWEDAKSPVRVTGVHSGALARVGQDHPVHLRLRLHPGAAPARMELSVHLARVHDHGTGHVEARNRPVAVRSPEQKAVTTFYAVRVRPPAAGAWIAIARIVREHAETGARRIVARYALPLPILAK